MWLLSCHGAGFGTIIHSSLYKDWTASHPHWLHEMFFKTSIYISAFIFGFGFTKYNVPSVSESWVLWTSFIEMYELLWWTLFPNTKIIILYEASQSTANILQYMSSTCQSLEWSDCNGGRHCMIPSVQSGKSFHQLWHQSYLREVWIRWEKNVFGLKVTMNDVHAVKVF